MRSENRRKYLAGLLFLITIVLLSLAMYCFYRVTLDIISSGRVRLGLESPEYKRLEAPILRPFEAAPPQPVEIKHHSAEETSTHVLLTFTAYKLIPGAPKLAGDLSFKVPVPLKERFEPQLSEIIGCPEGRTGARARPKVDGEYADKNLLVSLLNESGSPSVKIPIPLEDFLASSINSDSETCEAKREDIINRSTEFRVPTELPVLAGPIREYPSDYHQLSTNVEIRLPKGFTLSGATQEDVSGLGTLSTTLPHMMRIRSSQGMEGRTISLLRPETSLPLPRSIDEPRITATNVNTMASPPTTQVDIPSQDDVDLRMLMVRDFRTQLFAYLVAFLPLALLAALVTGALLAAPSDNESTVTSITVNLAVATLAILPLRAVLVPPDLQGLTRIDYILVIQLLLIISVAFLLNGWQLWVSHPRRNAEKGDHEQANH
jgi:hypothetical protein